ncbi:CP family cyanate transporter-like MFS transporter [Kribbella amoyensis]|uniref:CP family cyanate transporter-like MFS transporter n=1 Tax=Kribbella amoyensis TaxID=996641 RepID=A0A561B9D9_9ACTN|nr:MFS transporter [Kribbella amoyensis]TWD75429.1 CP family cyanate transporter-like MFS transporter [Kribbella amoyensis]
MADLKPETVTRWAPVVTATVFLVALCLRPALTAVGPVLPRIGADEGLGEAAQGVLGALPLLAFAAASPLVHFASRRIGMERTVLVSLVVLAVSSVLRAYTGQAGLWIGTVVVGAAIAVGNVLVPVILKRDYAAHVSRATGIYTAFITGGAALASILAVPIADAVDWRLSLAVWGGLAVLAAVIWLPRSIRPAPLPVTTTEDAAPPVSVWRQPMAWLVTGYMGLQSTSFYLLVNWLPTIEISHGVAERTTGVHLFLFQGFGLIGGLTIPRLMRHPLDQRAGTITASVPIVIALLGLLLAPELAVVWAMLAGLGQGAALVAALTLISLRGRSHHETTQLSGMAQAVGYLLAATGPVIAGYLAERTGGWDATLIVFACLAAVQVGLGIAAGRDTRGTAQVSRP